VLNLIDAGLEAFLRSTVPLGAEDVDVSFEPPDRDWSAKLNRPTVNLFLWDIRKSSDRARAGVEELEHDGRLVRRLALPRVELRYLVTAWTSDHGDERALLSGVMRAILAHSELPKAYLPDPLHALPLVAMFMPRTGEDQVDVFKALEGQLKPGINLVVVPPVDTGVFTEAGPPAEAFEFRMSDRNTDAGPISTVRRVAGEVLDPTAPGALVTSPVGSTTVNPAGRFLINARSGDELVVHLPSPVTVVVPPEGGVRIT
jgi:hypothetical protein